MFNTRGTYPAIKEQKYTYSIRFADGSFVARANGSRRAFASEAGVIRALGVGRRIAADTHGVLSAQSRAWDSALVVRFVNGKLDDSYRG